MLKVKSSLCKKALIGALAAFLMVSGCKYPSLTVNAATYTENAKSLTTDYTINNWGLGYQVLIKVKNETGKRAETWSLKVNKNDVDIDSSWNVNIKEAGDYYEITPMTCNSVVEPGNAVEFGVQGSKHIGSKVEIFAEGEVKQDEQGQGQSGEQGQGQSGEQGQGQSGELGQGQSGEQGQGQSGEQGQGESGQGQQEVTPGKASVEYTINNWGSGYQVLIKVKNEGTQNVNSWTLKVDKNDVKIDNSWCVNVKESGNYYVITPMEWNSVIEPGRSVDFGIQGNGSIGTTVGMTVE